MNIPSRLKTLDLIKALSLIVIFLTHLFYVWGDNSFLSGYALIQTIIRPIGPAAFIFCAIFGSLISFNMQEEITDDKSILYRTLKRTIIYLVLGAFINFLCNGMFILGIGGPQYPWYYSIATILIKFNVFTFMGVANITLYFFRKLPIVPKIIITILFFAMYFILLEIIRAFFISVGIDFNADLRVWDAGDYQNSVLFVLHFFLYQDSDMASIMPWLGFVFIMTIILEPFCASIANKDEKSIILNLRKSKISTGIVLLASVIIGFPLTEGYLTNKYYLELIHSDAFKIWPESLGGMPLFLQRSTGFYIFYSFGYVSIITLFLIEYLDFKGKSFKGLDTLTRFGKYSMTVFITHALIVLFPMNLILVPFIIVYFIFTLGYIILINIWDRTIQGMFSFEWMIQKVMKYSFRSLIDKSRTQKE
ncbi:MAG: hypothetical protein ACFFCS_22115 [Candidatus Hodarchaeota archaeon]